MGNSLLVVEGVHDAAFFSILLGEKKFQPVKLVADVPSVWARLIPRNFPVKDNLDHVVHYPDIFVHPTDKDTTVAILVGKGITLIEDHLKEAVAILPLDQIDKFAICVDADSDPNNGFAEIVKIYKELSAWGLSEGYFEKPLNIPDAANIFSVDRIRIGGIVLPDSSSEGALENILISLANEKHPEISSRGLSLINEVNALYPPNDKTLKKFRKGGNRYKTHASIVSNFLFPGASLAVSITQADWIPQESHELLDSIRGFVDELIK